MLHDLIKTGDADAVPAICDRNNEVVLDYCRRCKRGEGELGPACPATSDETVGFTSDVIGERERGALRLWFNLESRFAYVGTYGEAFETARYNPSTDMIDWRGIWRTIEEINLMPEMYVMSTSLQARAERTITSEEWDELASCARSRYVEIQATTSPETRQALLLLVEKCTVRAAAAKEGRCMP